MKWIIAITFLAIVSVGAENVDDWYGGNFVDSMTDEESIVLITYNSDDLFEASWDLLMGSDTDAPYLIIVFDDGSNVPLIGVGFEAFIGSVGGNHICLTRIDDNPAVNYDARIESGSESIIFSIGTDHETKEFFADLLRGNEFQVRFRPSGQSQITLSFSLSGITGLSRELGIDVDHYLSLSDETSDSQVTTTSRLKR